MPEDAEGGGAEQNEPEDRRPKIDVMSEAVRLSPAGAWEEAKGLANVGGGDDPEAQRGKQDQAKRRRSTPPVGDCRADHQYDRKRKCYGRSQSHGETGSPA
jgi:hypothetical protein